MENIDILYAYKCKDNNNQSFVYLTLSPNDMFGTFVKSYKGQKTNDELHSSNFNDISVGDVVCVNITNCEVAHYLIVE